MIYRDDLDGMGCAQCDDSQQRAPLHFSTRCHPSRHLRVTIVLGGDGSSVAFACHRCGQLAAKVAVETPRANVVHSLIAHEHDDEHRTASYFNGVLGVACDVCDRLLAVFEVRRKAGEQGAAESA